METTIAVTGATGTIGSALVPELLERGARVRALTRSLEGRPPASGLEWVEADLADAGRLPGVLEGADRLFLLTGNDDSMVRLQKNAVEAAKRPHRGRHRYGGAPHRTPRPHPPRIRRGPRRPPERGRRLTGSGRARGSAAQLPSVRATDGRERACQTDLRRGSSSANRTDPGEFRAGIRWHADCCHPATERDRSTVQSREVMSMLPAIGTRFSRLAPSTLLEDLNGTVERMFGDPLLFQPRTTGRHPADVAEDAESIGVWIEAPGYDPESFDLQVMNGVLWVSASPVPEETGGEDGSGRRFWIRERTVDEWRRGFVLPSSVDVDAIEATYRDGVLHVELPKVEEARPRRIPVEAGGRKKLFGARSS